MTDIPVGLAVNSKGQHKKKKKKKFCTERSMTDILSLLIALG